MIIRYGMSEALGLGTFEAPRQALFLQVPTGTPRAHSNETVHIISAENGCVARGTPPWGAEEKQMLYFDRKAVFVRFATVHRERRPGQQSRGGGG
jgi:hypothetical protein